MQEITKVDISVTNVKETQIRWEDVRNDVGNCGVENQGLNTLRLYLLVDSG